MPHENQSLHRKPPILTQHARDMRKVPSKAENSLWLVLRNRQVDGLKFRRQHVLGSYIADFFCEEQRLVVELDGDSHASQEIYDLQRTQWLESQDLRVMRFTNFDVLENMDAVVLAIRDACGRKA